MDSEKFSINLPGIVGCIILLLAPARLLVWMLGGDFLPDINAFVIGRDFLIGVVFWASLIYLCSLGGRHVIFIVVGVAWGFFLATTFRLGFSLPVWVCWMTFLLSLPFGWVCAWYCYWNLKLLAADIDDGNRS